MTRVTDSASLSSPMRAGGRATEAGMAFQAAVATWIAVHILVRKPIGGRFDINNQSLPVAIRLETGDGLDDIDVTQSDGGAIKIQCKTTANLGTGSNSALKKTVDQLVLWVADATADGGLPDLISNIAVLAVRDDAPRTLDNLSAGCRAFALGGDWAETLSQRSQHERAALVIFRTFAFAAWVQHRDGVGPEDVDLAYLASIFRISRFRMDEGDFDWREASTLLGRHLFEDETVGDAPLRDLRGIMRDLIGSGAPADRNGLLRALRQRGHHDTAAPGFEVDVAKLREVTERELARLAKHALLPIGEGVSITRESDADLVAAMQSGSLLLVGEPGAGKTGALVHAASAISAVGDTVVFLSVDRYSGVSIATQLESELGLTHSVVESLESMPGVGRKILIIDALDAARSGLSEAVFATLIEDVHDRLTNDWIVVASIRTFDLKNGHRFRQVFAGAPADERYVEPDLNRVRHFLVPRLSESDIVAVGRVSPELGTLLASAQPGLVDLLCNIFNLSLAAQLLADGRDPATFSAISSQSGLIDAYEERRLNTTMLRQATKATVAEMIRRRRLTVRKDRIEHSALDEVIQTGVLSTNGDFVSFSHHVLFDHAAGHFYLDWDDPEALLAQLAGEISIAIFIAPALRFAIEYLWNYDVHRGRPSFWTLIIGIFAKTSVDPILGNVALRVAVEKVENTHDFIGLTQKVVESPTDPLLVSLLGRLALFAKMDIESARAFSLNKTLAWTKLAKTLGVRGEKALVYPVRILLQALFDRVDFANKEFLSVYGMASRALLELAWSDMPALIAFSESAIRFVGKSFASAPNDSRALLERILHEPHFSQYADREATWLAEQILPVTLVAPEFTVEIYSALYGQSINDSSTSWIGGQQSRILPLSSNRQQDYKQCLWKLGSAIGKVLAISPYYGTRALIDALIGNAQNRAYDGNHDPYIINVDGKPIELRGSEIEFNAWHEEKYDDRAHDSDLLRNYVRFLRECNAIAFASSLGAASFNYATAAVWARIFGVGSERVAEVGDLLWPLIERPDFLENSGILCDAVRFITAAWPSRTPEERLQFESMALDVTRFASEEEQNRWHQILGRILALVPENALEMNAMRLLRRQLEEKCVLKDNSPIYQFGSFWSDHDDVVRADMRRAGVDMDSGSDQEVFDISEALNELVKNTPPSSSASDLAVLWQESVALITMIDATAALHDFVDRQAWGYVANAVERVASSQNYESGKDGLPDIASMFVVLERLSLSPYPEQSEEGNKRIFWGNLDVRVYTTHAWVALASRFALEYPAILDQIEAALADPVPAVRLQVAKDLQVISLAAPERMWEMAEQIVTHEKVSEILAFFLSGSVRRLTYFNLDRIEALLTIVKERFITDFVRDIESQDCLLFEPLGGLVANLFVWHGCELVRSWLVEWAAEPDRFGVLIEYFTSSLRGAFFYRYVQDAQQDVREICDRAQEGLLIILRESTRISAEAHQELHSDISESVKLVASKKFRAAEDVIHHAMNQLYFGSGANADDRESGVGLTDAVFMKRFLNDYSESLSLIASSHEPATLYYLIELYEFLIRADPVRVFEALHTILLGRGKEEGYQFESLAVSSFVRIVKRYLADHRTLFEDDIRRAKLVSILQLFSDVGWIDALQLLYDLPDLLR